MGYFKEVIQKIKKRVTGTDRKKLTENAIIIVIIGIILLLAAGPILGIKKEGSASETINSQNKGDSSNLTPVNADHTERKLEELLSGMSGAGKVQVMITYYNGIEKITAYDIKKSSSETEEIDSEGGKRTIIESEYESTTLYEDVSSGIRACCTERDISRGKGCCSGSGGSRQRGSQGEDYESGQCSDGYTGAQDTGF